MENKKYIYKLVDSILNSDTPNKSELVGYLRDFAYSESMDMDTILYVINSLYPILEKHLDLTIPDNDSLQDGILDLYSIFALEQGYYTEYIRQKISLLDVTHLPKSCNDYITDGLLE